MLLCCHYAAIMLLLLFAGYTNADVLSGHLKAHLHADRLELQRRYPAVLVDVEQHELTPISVKGIATFTGQLRVQRLF